MPLNKPTLSVILPAYNAEKYIREAIDSILNQTYTDFELIIADDASTDKTKEIIDSYKDMRIIKSHNRTKKGKIETVNRLFKFCTGKYLTIHDADDFSLEARFEKQLKLFKVDTDLVLVGGNFFSINKKNKILAKSNLLSDSDKLKEGMYTGPKFHCPTVIFRKSVLEKVKYIYRPFFKDYNEDYDLCFRVCELGKVTNIMDPIYYYRITENSLSRTLTPQKKVSTKIVQYLAKQRLSEIGVDDLENGNIKKVIQLLNDLIAAYKKDPSKIIREQVELDFYYKFYLSSFVNAFRAIIIAPLKIRNYRLLQHIIRKKILGF